MFYQFSWSAADIIRLGVFLIDALFTECDHVLPRSWDDSSFKMFRVYVLHLTPPKFKTDMSMYHITKMI